MTAARTPAAPEGPASRRNHVFARHYPSPAEILAAAQARLVAARRDAVRAEQSRDRAGTQVRAAAAELQFAIARKIEEGEAVSDSTNPESEIPTQRAFIGTELVPMYEEQAAGRRAEGNRRGGQGKSSANLRGTSGATPEKASEAAARAVNVSARSVESALKVASFNLGEIESPT